MRQQRDGNVIGIDDRGHPIEPLALERIAHDLFAIGRVQVPKAALMQSLRVGVELVELRRPPRERRRPGGAQTLRTVAVNQLGAFLLLRRPVTKRRRLARDAGAPETRRKNGQRERIERRLISLDMFDRRRMRASNNDGERNRGGE